MMPNRPEYLAIWLGLTSVGVVVALVNTNLRGVSLAHCIDLVEPAYVTVAAELSEQFRSAVAELKSEPKIWSHGGDEFERIDPAVEELSSKRLSAPERRAVTIADRALGLDAHVLPRESDLYVRHDRISEGRQCEPPAAAAVELLVRRPHEHRARRPHVRLPAALSQRRRRRGDRVGAGARRLGRDPRKILGAAFLGRHRRMDCTLVQYIGELALSPQRAASSARASASHPAVLRQWFAGGRLGEIPGAFQDSAHPGILCRH
jgi:hypothetical protein